MEQVQVMPPLAGEFSRLTFDHNLQRSTLHGTSGGFCPARGPPPLRSWSPFFCNFCSFEFNRDIDTVMGHASVHIDCHLISCTRVGAPEALQECVEITATLQHTTARTTRRTTHTYIPTSATDTPTEQHTTKTKHGVVRGTVSRMPD